MTDDRPRAAPAHFPYNHRTVAQVWASEEAAQQMKRVTVPLLPPYRCV